MFDRPGEYKRFMPRTMTDSTHCVVLVHGLFMWGIQFETMARKFTKRGYASFLYDYPTRMKDIHGHGCDFKKYISTLMKEFPESRINFVTHSLGGLVTREAISMLDESELAKVGRTVMLAPPNKGSHVAKCVMKYIPFASDIYKPIRDLDSSPGSPVYSLPDMKGKPFAVIGAGHDYLVNRTQTSLDSEAYNETLEDHIHSSLMFGHRSFRLTEQFIRCGHMTE